jgi:hypothetical protein
MEDGEIEIDTEIEGLAHQVYLEKKEEYLKKIMKVFLIKIIIIIKLFIKKTNSINNNKVNIINNTNKINEKNLIIN